MNLGVETLQLQRLYKGFEITQNDFHVRIRESKFRINTVQLIKIVGWVERKRYPKSLENVGFRSSTQPTPVLVFSVNPSVLNSE